MTGIYFADYEAFRKAGLDFKEIELYAQELPGVKSTWNGNLDLSGHPDKIRDMISEVDRIIIAGTKPGRYKNLFSKYLKETGKDPDNVVLANLRKMDYDQVKADLFCAVEGIPKERLAKAGENDVHPETLVIGAGIAGIQASLEIANSKNKVYLLERTGTIGGHMAMFDKTFPTLDCAACILTPKMVEIGQHENITLMTYCEVQEVKGGPGEFRVKILKKARRVDITACIGCGICSEKCPSKVPSEFDSGTTLRKAIYIPFPQAVPNKYLIDAENCRWVTEGKCGVCVKVCPAECINLDEKDEIVEITVGNIIIATGFKPFDAGRIDRFGYGKLPNVVTSLEFERLVNASGPTGGNIRYRTQDKKGNWIFEEDGKEPSSFAIIHCVGSRDENHNKYCSRVCCMYSLKLAHLVKEKAPDAEVLEFYIDMRAFGKGYEEFYERIKDEGINVIRGKTATIEDADGQLLLRSEDMINHKLLENKVDMVILSVGLEPCEDSPEISKMLGINTGPEGWFKEYDSLSGAVGTNIPGIAVAGACQGPKDIPDSVAQGAAAAAKVLQIILNGKINRSMDEVKLSEIENNAKKLTSMMEGLK